MLKIWAAGRCTVDSVVDPMEPVVLKGDESDPMGRDLTRYEWVIAQAPNGRSIKLAKFSQLYCKLYRIV